MLNRLATSVNDAGIWLAAATPTAPKIDWVPEQGLKEWSSHIALAIIVIWVLYIGFQYAIPSKGKARIQWGRFLAVLVLAVFMLDLTLLPTLANTALDIGWNILKFFGVFK